jgi:hypothetical protein
LDYLGKGLRTFRKCNKPLIKFQRADVYYHIRTTTYVLQYTTKPCHWNTEGTRTALFFFHGSTAPWGPRPPHVSRLHDHTQTHHTR